MLAEAEAEVTAACDYLDSRTKGLAARFLIDLSETLSALVERPFSFATLETFPNSPYRRALLSTFRYVVVFKILDDEVIVVAIAHASRDPGYWLGRRD